MSHLRRRLIVTWFSLCLGLGAPLAVAGPVTAADPRPNIIFIVTDDQRSNLFGVMPQTRDWLFTGGTRFTDAFTATPLCCPSRASIMSGRYVHNHGVRTNDSSGQLNQSQTLQRYLHDAGYRTGIFGKYFNHWNLSRDPLYFDRWGIMSGGYTNWYANVQGTQTRISTYSTDWIAAQAEEFIAQQDDQPFFLYLAPYSPHSPFTPAARHASASVPAFKGNPAVNETDLSDKPAYVRELAATADRTRITRTVPRQQKRTLLAVDEMVGRVRQALSGAGELENTLVVYVSDNGFLWGEHGLADKRAPYSQSISVPMMVSWPGQFAPGATDTRLASLVDLAPTVLDTLDLVPEQPMDGRSLLDPLNVRDRVLVEYFYDGFYGGKIIPAWATLRTNEYQYVEYYTDDSRQMIAFREYYDLIRDPWQLVNLLGDSDGSNDPAPEALFAMSAQLAADRECAGPLCP